MARKKQEFKPDARASILKKFYITKLQRLKMLKWGLYAVLCILLLVIQDVIMSRISVFGVTTDLAPMIILLITVLVGSEYGSVFVLIASTFFALSGSAPGPYVILLLTGYGIFATLIRQLFWRRGLRSTALCAGIALVAYEMSIFVIGAVTGLTRWDRVLIFLMDGLVSWALMLPLYPLCYQIGKIGGEPWKE